ncbi:hypothetical protein [Natronolimnobius baerhuensis]|uniref:Uncharacterized protein n=1 Tax=Natronolimnobius baerhuensis TaxID=253108 RepID=A0A202E9M8_9EURY|nr:hypothetical protein [Natronolimnobius baerhuensis]OVE84937.1 hypothetical protein B2G88_11275 [Natronolimnobius baerhuensis]
MDATQRVTELDAPAVESLAAQALEAPALTRLESYFDEQYGETVPTDEPRAFERGDGVRAVTFEADPDATGKPARGITVHFDDETVVQVTGERRGEAVDGDLELLFPTETAPKPETAVRELYQPEGDALEVAVTVTETNDVTSYMIDA